MWTFMIPENYWLLFFVTSQSLILQKNPLQLRKYQKLNQKLQSLNCPTIILEAFYIEKDRTCMFVSVAGALYRLKALYMSSGLASTAVRLIGNWQPTCCMCAEV